MEDFIIEDGVLKEYVGEESDDFATVDLREDYANLSLPKEAKFKR